MLWKRLFAAGDTSTGGGISLVDVNYAPLFQRLEYMHRIKPAVFDRHRHPKIWAWKERLLEMPAFKGSCVPQMEGLYQRLLWKSRGYISQFLDESVKTDTDRGVY